MDKIRAVLHVVNLPKKVCHALLGKDHHVAFRFAAGGVIMLGGVSLAKAGHHYQDLWILEYGMDVAGYFIHALGGVPYLEWLIEEVEEDL